MDGGGGGVTWILSPLGICVTPISDFSQSHLTDYGYFSRNNVCKRYINSLNKITFLMTTIIGPMVNEVNVHTSPEILCLQTFCPLSIYNSVPPKVVSPTNVQRGCIYSNLQSLVDRLYLYELTAKPWDRHSMLKYDNMLHY